tara:strand:- start:1527 stop:1697 length:171 start_codon:yes stop_codon:yes gene_type:complete
MHENSPDVQIGGSSKFDKKNVASEGSFDRNSSGCSISSHNSHDDPENTTNQRKVSF